MLNFQSAPVTSYIIAAAQASLKLVSLHAPKDRKRIAAMTIRRCSIQTISTAVSLIRKKDDEGMHETRCQIVVHGMIARGLKGTVTCAERECATAYVFPRGSVF